MPAPTPGNWRHIALSWAFALLVVVVVLHVAARLLADIEPELIAMAIVAAIVYGVYLVYRFRKSRW